jgi:hypothetical protein
MHYNCINNPHKLRPICPSIDMKIDDNNMVINAQKLSITQKKYTQQSTAEKSFSKKKKASNKNNGFTILKKLIEELRTNIPNSGKVLEKSNVSGTLPNTRTSGRKKFLHL